MWLIGARWYPDIAVVVAYLFMPPLQAVVDPAGVFSIVDTASRITAYGLLILFVLAGWKQIVMWRWQHLEIVKEMQKQLDDRDKRIVSLEAELVSKQDDCDERIAAAIEDKKARRLEDQADFRAQLAEAKDQVVMWRDAFLSASGFAERSVAVADKATTALKREG